MANVSGEFQRLVGSVSRVSSTPPGWVRHVSSAGDVYFHSIAHGSQWQVPDDVSAYDLALRAHSSDVENVKQQLVAICDRVNIWIQAKCISPIEHPHVKQCQIAALPGHGEAAGGTLNVPAVGTNLSCKAGQGFCGTLDLSPTSPAPASDDEMILGVALASPSAPYLFPVKAPPPAPCSGMLPVGTYGLPVGGPTTIPSTPATPLTPMPYTSVGSDGKQLPFHAGFGSPVHAAQFAGGAVAPVTFGAQNLGFPEVPAGPMSSPLVAPPFAQGSNLQFQPSPTLCPQPSGGEPMLQLVPSDSPVSVELFQENLAFWTNQLKTLPEHCNKQINLYFAIASQWDTIKLLECATRMDIQCSHSEPHPFPPFAVPAGPADDSQPTIRIIWQLGPKAGKRSHCMTLQVNKADFQLRIQAKRVVYTEPRMFKVLANIGKLAAVSSGAVPQAATGVDKNPKTAPTWESMLGQVGGARKSSAVKR